MRPWFALPARGAPVRATEASAEQIIATGALAGSYGRDPIDGDIGYRPAGSLGRREVPYWTLERARTGSVAAYRSNPMATAIIDTYTAFCVGDSGVKVEVTNPDVKVVVDEFWNDPRNACGKIQALALRSTMLLGEKIYELMVGEHSGVVRFGPIDPINVDQVRCLNGNPAWPDVVVLVAEAGAEPRELTVAQVNDVTQLREGQAMFWAPWKTLDTDIRGYPFLTPILDWLDSYETVLSNLMDRTALARHVVFDVSVKGGQNDVDTYVAARRGLHTPPSGSVEVHSDAITWNTLTASTGAMEDTQAAAGALTSVAAGAGLSKHWLAEPDGANRATSHTMAEPVRRRVAGVQAVWLAAQRELVAYAVDRAVAAKRLAATVEVTDPRSGAISEIRASDAINVTGPEIAAADAAITAQVLLNLSTGLQQLVETGALTPKAAAAAARKGWEDYMGIPYQSDLDTPDANPDDLATHVDDAATQARKLRSVPA